MGVGDENPQFEPNMSYLTCSLTEESIECRYRITCDKSRVYNREVNFAIFFLLSYSNDIRFNTFLYRDLPSLRLKKQKQ